MDCTSHLGGHIDSVVSGMDTFGCKQAHRSVEDVHPFTWIALMVMSPTPRMVQAAKETALMLAIQKKKGEMVTVLLDGNVNPDIQDEVRQGPQ